MLLRLLAMPWNGMGETNFRTPVRTITYSYDKLYRLTRASYSSGGFFVYAYDAVGNCISATDASGTHSCVYDKANRLTQVDGAVYQWDANGTLLSAGTSTYTYDAANRLISVSNSPDGTTSFSYDGIGNRVSKTTGAPRPAMLLTSQLACGGHRGDGYEQ